jgi:6-phosphogluconolactonase
MLFGFALAAACDAQSPSLSDDLAGAPFDGSAGTDGAGSPDLRPGVAFVYVSGYSPQIAHYRLDPTTGALTEPTTLAITGSPSYLAFDPAARHLFAVDEATAGQVESFAIDPATGALTHLNDVSSGGNGPAHVSVDHSGAWALAANYGDGTVSVLPIHGDGTLGAATTLTAGANAHEILPSPSNLFVFVPCKGTDYIAQYLFNAQTGALAPNAKPTVAATPGTGPRHLAFHPNGQYVYIIQETASTITLYNLDAVQGTLSAMQTVSSLAEPFTGTNTGAEVAVHPNGKFLYGSNRGDDSIAIFSLDAGGHMKVIARQAAGGQTPRDFTIDPTGHFLIVANQDSNNVVVFSIDAATGLLTTAGAPITAPSPSFVGVINLPGA